MELRTEAPNTKHRLRFSGHESFVCRISWLHKGLRFVADSPRDFNDPEAVIDLGVGKNMVNAIRFWLRAFGLTNESDDKLTKLGHFLRIEGEDPRDPYFEMPGTTWLLLHSLVTGNYASIFHFYFNEFQADRVQFTESQLQRAIELKCSAEGFDLSENTLTRDIAMFIRSLQKPEAHAKSDPEELFTGALTGLDLMTVERFKSEKGESDLLYRVRRDRRPDLPWQVFLYAIKHKLKDRQIVSLKDLLVSPDWPGLVFCMSKEGLLEKIDELTRAMPGKVTFSQTAGNEVLQLQGITDEWEGLRAYYQD